jgi:hypothetical protein
MKARCLLLILAVLVGSATSPSFASANTNKVRVLPFKVWKTKKIDEAKSIVAEFKRQQRQVSQGSENEDEKQELAQKLSQSQLNLAVAKELSANDYFLLYVSPQFKDNPSAFLEAAKTLSAKDTAEILGAYQKRLQASDANDDTGAPNPVTELTPPEPEKTAKQP